MARQRSGSSSSNGSSRATSRRSGGSTRSASSRRRSSANRQPTQLTNLETKLGEVIGLAMAAQVATEKVIGLAGDASMKRSLKQMQKEAAEAEKLGTAAAASFSGKKAKILQEARSVKKKGGEMLKTYLDRDADELDGFEFLTMAEAGEVGHWTVLGEMNKTAKNAQVRDLVRMQLPIQKRHLKEVMATSVQLAAKEDPNESS